MTNQIISAAQISAGLQAANEAAAKREGSGYMGACGFAWVDVEVTRTNSKQAKELKAAGFSPSYIPRRMTMWNPSKFASQNVDTLEAGAVVYAEYLRSLGLKACARSRLD